MHVDLNQSFPVPIDTMAADDESSGGSTIIGFHLHVSDDGNEVNCLGSYEHKKGEKPPPPPAYFDLSMLESSQSMAAASNASLSLDSDDKSKGKATFDDCVGGDLVDSSDDDSWFLIRQQVLKKR